MNSVHVEYACGEWFRVRVDLAQQSTCPRCGDPVKKVNTHEWRVRCPNCRYGRWCGQSQDEAERNGTNHRKQHPNHWPSVAYDRVTWDGKGTVLRWDDGSVKRRPPSGTLTEPAPGQPEGIPPF